MPKNKDVSEKDLAALKLLAKIIAWFGTIHQYWEAFLPLYLLLMILVLHLQKVTNLLTVYKYQKMSNF